MIAADGLPEDRVTCGVCRHSDAGSFRCRKYRVSVLIDLPLRCIGFDPLPGAPDQRDGSKRWPNLLKDIEAIREIEKSWPRS